LPVEEIPQNSFFIHIFYLKKAGERPKTVKVSSLLLRNIYACLADWLRLLRLIKMKEYAWKAVVDENDMNKQYKSSFDFLYDEEDSGRLWRIKK